MEFIDVVLSISYENQKRIFDYLDKKSLFNLLLACPWINNLLTENDKYIRKNITNAIESKNLKVLYHCWNLSILPQKVNPDIITIEGEVKTKKQCVFIISQLLDYTFYNCPLLVRCKVVSILYEFISRYFHLMLTDCCEETLKHLKITAKKYKYLCNSLNKNPNLKQYYERFKKYSFLQDLENIKISNLKTDERLQFGVCFVDLVLEPYVKFTFLKSDLFPEPLVIQFK